jgi:hypothetical protein
VIPLWASLLAFACILGGAFLGMVLRAFLPEHHLSADSKDLVRVGMGLVGATTALVLGLMVASAKGSYDTQKSELVQMSAGIVVLDRILAHYGPETKEVRELLRAATTRALAQIWPEDRSRPSPAPRSAGDEILYDKLEELTPKDDSHRSLQARALNVAMELTRARWLMFEQSGSAISRPFLVVVVFWLTVMFVSFGLFAPSNTTVIATLFICALSVSGAIFLILEMDTPFAGLIQISSAPLRVALAQLGQ